MFGQRGWIVKEVGKTMLIVYDRRLEPYATCIRDSVGNFIDSHTFTRYTDAKDDFYNRLPN